MAQLFGPQSNWISRVVLVGLPIGFLLAIVVAEAVDRSGYVTDKDRFIDQPVPFSHKHHVGELGLDCRYCHTQVEKSAVASVPSSEVCLTCHRTIWKEAPMLKPVHESFDKGVPIRWMKVTKLPGFVYFNHSIHVNKGVGCVTCHGNVATMSLTHLEHPMTMEFCLNCHRSPEKYLREKEKVFSTDIDYLSDEEQQRLGNYLVERYGVQKKVDCVTCHR
jgi:hypothetical protein